MPPPFLDARSHLFDAPRMVFFPALAVTTAVLLQSLGRGLPRLWAAALPFFRNLVVAGLQTRDTVPVISSESRSLRHCARYAQ